LVIWADGHANHIHMEWEIPDGVALTSAFATATIGAFNEAIVSEGVAGSVSKDKVKPLTKEQMKLEVGKI